MILFQTSEAAIQYAASCAARRRVRAITVSGRTRFEVTADLSGDDFLYDNHGQPERTPSMTPTGKAYFDFGVALSKIALSFDYPQQDAVRGPDPKIEQHVCDDCGAPMLPEFDGNTICEGCAKRKLQIVEEDGDDREYR